MQRAETETNLTNLLMGELLDAARTGKFHKKQVVYSAPYEKVEIEAVSPARLRKRAHTVPRALLAQKPRYSAPYVAIEISVEPSMVASGSFEAAWFALPDEQIVETEAPARIDATRWMITGGAVLGVLAGVIGLLTLL